MDYPIRGRRSFLQRMSAFGALGLPAGSALLASPAHAADAAPAGAPKVVYDPMAKFPIEVSELEFRRTASGRVLMARVYRPLGAGPFPALLDLHGGAWNNKDRTANEPMDRAVAESGVLVVAIDLTLAPEAPYPAAVQDANYGVRWLKSKAAAWRGDPTTLGVLGSSTGGHIAELLGMRPRDPRYNAIALPGASGIDATLTYIATRSPISDPYARFLQAEKMQRPAMIKSTQTFFVPWDSIQEANPQRVLERREPVTLPPLLVMQGALDDNVLPEIQEKFAAAYRAAGGDIRYELFEGCEHEWIAKPGPHTDRAHAMVKAFIAERLRQPKNAGERTLTTSKGERDELAFTR
ncbi:MAG: alpha/beta hydrolase [Vicinamibacterales bacterium]